MTVIENKDIYSIDFHVVRNSEEIELNYNWEYTDKEGHLHEWQDGRLTNSVSIYDKDIEDEEYFCSYCEEQLFPGYATIQNKIHSVSLKAFTKDIMLRRDDEILLKYMNKQFRLKVKNFSVNFGLYEGPSIELYDALILH
jgi:hypothetical protein